MGWFLSSCIFCCALPLSSQKIPGQYLQTFADFADFVIILILIIILKYCTLFEESRAVVTQKLSGRRQEILEQWKKLTSSRKNVIPGQQFHVLLAGRERSPEALRRKVKNSASKESHTE